MRASTILAAATLACAAAAPVAAQPIAQADLTGIVGWFNANKSAVSAYDDWYNRSAYAGAVVGWYWTDHLKTEVELGATSTAELYAVRTIDVGGQQAYASAQHRFNTRRLTIGQQYQFLRNAWAHPHAAFGLDLTRETHEQHDDAVVRFDQVAGTPRVLREARTFGPTTTLQVRPYAEIGTKLYLSQRGFFRSDLRLTFRDGVDEVVLRFGLGVDF